MKSLSNYFLNVSIFNNQTWIELSNCPMFVACLADSHQGSHFLGKAAFVLEDARKKVPPECALSAEADIYACNARLLQLLGENGIRFMSISINSVSFKMLHVFFPHCFTKLTMFEKEGTSPKSG